jgi:hypothetical protein
VVRSTVVISGYFMEEVEPGVVEIHFLVETDFKISLFI